MARSIILILIIICSHAKAQIPVEIYGGHEKTTIDIMFFKYFKIAKEKILLGCFSIEIERALTIA